MPHSPTYDYNVKQGDTGDVSATLKRNDVAYDLTGATVRFHMRRSGAAATKVDAAATIVTAADGTVLYSWQAGDTDQPGVYEVEWEVTEAGGDILTFPNGGYSTLRIHEEIA